MVAMTPWALGGRCAVAAAGACRSRLREADLPRTSPAGVWGLGRPTGALGQDWVEAGSGADLRDLAPHRGSGFLGISWDGFHGRRVLI